MSEDPQLFQELLNEYEVIRSKLEAEITESGRSELFSDLIGLITRISDHIFRNEEKVRKGIGEIMGPYRSVNRFFSLSSHLQNMIPPTVHFPQNNRI